MAYRKSIRIDGKQKKSPRFKRAADAVIWYDQQKRLKQFLSEGITIPVDSNMTLDEYFISKWLVDRKKNYPASTWTSDDQRYADYIQKNLGRRKIAKIQPLQVRLVIKAVVDAFGRSTETRNRVRSLLSKIFNDAMNEEPPLRVDNPAIGISFNDARKGRKKPNHLKRIAELEQFVTSAKDLGPMHWAYAATLLNAGPRKQEMIPLRWNDAQYDLHELVLDEKYIQASNEIVSGTKAGSEEVRSAPMSDSMIKALKAWHEATAFPDPEHFIFCDQKTGEHLSPKKLAELHNDVREASGLDITPHEGRHSFGRAYIAAGGSKEHLQTILGHSSVSTTELYSELAGEAVKKHRNTVNVGGGKK